jgi:hypothetical protein
MTARAFTKFDPRAFLNGEDCTGDTAKAAKAAKAASECAPGPERSATLATLAALAGRQAETQKSEPQPETWTDVEDERAAIIEFDGGAPRIWAEALARLDPTKPPIDVPPPRWLRFIDDCGRFLDQGWAPKAAALGWGPLDLFGCDRERPFVRVDHKGLLWLLNGGSIVQMHRDRATIKTQGGAQQTYRRDQSKSAAWCSRGSF